MITMRYDYKYNADHNVLYAVFLYCAFSKPSAARTAVEKAI